MFDLNKYFNKDTLYDVFDVTHMESDLYVNDGYLYKKMNLGYSSFDNKVNTINYLLDNKDIINIDEIVEILRISGVKLIVKKQTS